MPPLRRATDIVQKPMIRAPWPGITSHVPELVAEPGAFQDAENFILRAGRIISRPPFDAVTAPPDGFPIKAAVTFEDTLGSLHTFIATQQTAYFLTAGYVYNSLGLLKSTLSRPYSLAPAFRRIYFCNGGLPISYVDGSASVKDAGTVSSGATIAARYLMVLGGCLIAGYVTSPAPGIKGSITYPYQIAWSNTGNPDDWTPPSPIYASVAGTDNLVEVKDDIAGLVLLGSYGYVFRTTGITLISSTGNGQAPFYFQNLSNAPDGIGLAYPYSLSVYGSFCMFVGNDDVYIFDGSSYNNIGGRAVEDIFSDLSNSQGDYVIGKILPTWGGGFVYLSYILSIPGISYSWCFNFRDQSWGKIRYFTHVEVGDLDLPTFSYFTSLGSVAVA
jgi:hypothetical protein